VSIRNLSHRVCFYTMFGVFSVLIVCRLLVTDQESWTASPAFTVLAATLLGLLIYQGIVFLYAVNDLFAKSRQKKVLWLWYFIAVPIAGTYVYFEQFVLRRPSRAQSLRTARRAGVRHDWSAMTWTRSTYLRRRILAAIIDYGVFLIVLTMDFVLFAFQSADTLLLRGGPATGIMVFWLIWFPLAESVFGKTLGKTLVGLRVVDVTGMRIILRQTLIRHAVDALDVAMPILVLGSSERGIERLGDRIARTIVVQDLHPSDEVISESRHKANEETPGDHEVGSPILDCAILIIVGMVICAIVGSMVLHGIEYFSSGPGLSDPSGIIIQSIAHYWIICYLGLLALVVVPMVRRHEPSRLARVAFLTYGIFLWFFIGASLWTAPNLPDSESIAVIDYGLFEVRNAGAHVSDVFLSERTDTIPARLGSKFGIRYRLTGHSVGREITVRSVWKFPAPGQWDPVRRQAIDRAVRDETEVVGDTNYIGYHFDSQSEVLRGDWTLEVWCNRRQVFEKRFIVE
jgi:hypothetical protein